MLSGLGNEKQCRQLMDVEWENFLIWSTFQNYQGRLTTGSLLQLLLSFCFLYSKENQTRWKCSSVCFDVCCSGEMVSQPFYINNYYLTVWLNWFSGSLYTYILCRPDRDMVVKSYKQTLKFHKWFRNGFLSKLASISRLSCINLWLINNYLLSADLIESGRSLRRDLVNREFN